MKFCWIVIFIVAINFSKSGYGQATSSDFNSLVTTPNTPAPGIPNYLGWAFGVSLDLNIKNEDAMPIKFYTNAGAGGFANLRMMIDGNTGFVGLNHSDPPGGIPLAAPIFNLTIGWPSLGNVPRSDGGIIAYGHSGDGVFLPAGAADGDVFMWYPRLSAIRAGFANGGTWDHGNIGAQSAAFGNNNMASGQGSFSTGIGNVSSADFSVTFNKLNTSSGDCSFASGLFTESSGMVSIAQGYENLSSGDFSHARGNLVTAAGDISFGIGTYISALANGSITIGQGVGTIIAFPTESCRLINNISNSMMLGMNSDLPSIFIAPGNGLCAPNSIAGNVGINTTTPGNILEINSNATTPIPGASGLRFTDLNSTSTPQAFVPTKLTVDGNGDVILVDDTPGSGDVTACATHNPATDENFITKWINTGSPSPEICRTLSIFENNAGLVGINNSTPVYNFNVRGTSMFSLQAPPAAPYITYNTGFYPLAIKSDDTYDKGLGLYSKESTPKERLNLFANINGEVKFVSYRSPIVMRDQLMGNSYYGTNPELNSTIFAPDFETTSATYTPGSSVLSNAYPARVWIEGNNSNDGPTHGGGGSVVPALKVKNSVSNINYLNETAVEVECIGVSTNGFAKNIGVNIVCNGGLLSNIGIHSTAIDAGASITRGGYFVAREARDFNIGIYAEAHPDNSGNTLGTSIGGDFVAQKSKINYAVRATTPIGSCGFGTPPNCAEAAVYALGDVYTSGTYYNTSDIAFKNNVQPLINAGSILAQLTPKTYEFKVNQYPNIPLPSNLHHGLIAQDVETVLPDLVKTFIQPEETDSMGNVIHPEVSFKAVNYIEFIPILIAAYQEQQSELDSLKDKLTAMEFALNSLTGGSLKNNSNNVTEVKLENSMAIILDQNVPNPFADETKISYFLPEDISNAKIIFYETSGRILKEVELKTRGEGVVHVYGQDLSSGIYTYTLLIDGEVFETKKMVKAR